jgi:NADH-quinone oxidoreductase subunit G
MVIVGQAAVSRTDGLAVLAAAAKIAETASKPDWNAFNVLHAAAGRVAGLDLGFVPAKGGRDVSGMLSAAAHGDMDVLYLLGVDEIDLSRLGATFVVYQGSHGDAGAHRANVILPGAAYTEKGATYVNTEGRVQMTSKAGFPPGAAKEDWTILRAMSAKLGKTLPYDTLGALRAAMYREHPHLARIGSAPNAGREAVARLAATRGTLGSEPFGTAIADYYLTNPIARASTVMAELSALQRNVGGQRAAAE